MSSRSCRKTERRESEKKAQKGKKRWKDTKYREGEEECEKNRVGERNLTEGKRERMFADRWRDK